MGVVRLKKYQLILWLITCVSIVSIALLIAWQYSIYKADDMEPLQPDADVVDDTTASSGEQVMELGLEVYQDHCLACHGQEGAGGHNGPNLQESNVAPILEAVMERVNIGGETMPPFEDTLDHKEIEAVTAYVNKVVAKSKE
jgi:alcohol dehydrogenase (cytochrome c)